MRVFIDLFAGAGGVGRAMSRHGFWVLRWDILLGEGYNLLVPRTQRMLRGWVLSGLVAAWHAAFPCTSFSRARDRGGGPARLRSDARPEGLLNLSPADAIKVKDGNRLLQFVISLFYVSLRQGTPCSAENPRGSRAWLMPRMRVLLRHPGSLRSS